MKKIPIKKTAEILKKLGEDKNIPSHFKRIKKEAIT